jgi:potassium-transporting ATPase potassium-binding subunit
MTLLGLAQIAIYCAVILVFVVPLGAFMTRVFEGKRTWLHPVLRPVEVLIYRICRIDEQEDQHWLPYTVGMLLFNATGALAVYGLMRLQGFLPLNPQALGAVAPDLSFNTAISFTTNTNWQNYGGETTLSYLTQMAGMAVQNFMSAATGMALAVAVIRGFSRHSAKAIGNSFVDMTRSIVYILLPMCIVFTVFLVWQGIPQNFDSYTKVKTLEGAEQIIPQGPIASQIAIKMLGTNGGGFLNANSAHPFENPTPLANFVQMLSIFLIGAAFTNVLGRMVGDQRQGWAILGAMTVLFVAVAVWTYWAEAQGNPILTSLGVDQTPSAMQAGGNMEGKEVRFGVAASTLFAVITTAASCGAVNAMHSSFTALGGLGPLVNMLLGEVIVGGVGAGLYGILMFAVLAVFVAGLMVGRTPEYLGKKIEAYDVKMAMLSVLSLAFAILFFTGIATVVPAGLAGVGNPGPHGFSEIFYAFTSQAANNGSAFGSLSGNTVFYNTTGALDMFIGRFLMVIPLLALAGSLAAKKRLAPSAGTFPTHGPIFVGLLVGVIVIMAGLTFFPALTLGPVAEHYAMLAKQLF